MRSSQLKEGLRNHFKFASPFLVTVANERGFGSAIGRFNESEEGTGNPAKEEACVVRTPSRLSASVRAVSGDSGMRLSASVNGGRVRRSVYAGMIRCGPIAGCRRKTDFRYKFAIGEPESE